MAVFSVITRLLIVKLGTLEASEHPDCFDICPVAQQHCCWATWQMSKQTKRLILCFKIHQDFPIRCLICCEIDPKNVERSRPNPGRNCVASYCMTSHGNVKLHSSVTEWRREACCPPVLCTSSFYRYELWDHIHPQTYATMTRYTRPPFDLGNR